MVSNLACLWVHSEYVNSDSEAPEAYMVVTTALWRKYTVLGDLPLTALKFAWSIAAAVVSPSFSTDTAEVPERALVANTWRRYLTTRAAFRQHDSQYTWDRHLYMVLSRYVWFNDLVRARTAAPQPHS